MIKKKFMTTLALSLLSFTCAVGGVCFLNTTAETAEGNPDWLSSFKMVAGAEIRTAEPNGIRFTTEISVAQYNALMDQVGGGQYSSVEFGTLICPTYFADNNGGITSENNEYVSRVVRTTWDAEYNPSKETDVYQYNGDLVNIKNANLVQEFQALGYCTVTPVDGNAITYYAEVEKEGDNARTPLYVATYNIVNYQNDSDYLLSMVDTVMAENELVLSDCEDKTIDTGDGIALPEVTVAGKKIVAEFTSAEPGIAKIENGEIVGVAYGKTKITASIQGKTQAYKKSFNVTVNDTRFANQPVRTSNEIGGNRSLSTSIYYVKDDGVYAQATVNHDALNLGTQWETLRLSVLFAAANYAGGTISLTEQDVVCSISNMSGTFFAVENEASAATKYTSYITTYISQAQLTALGVDMTSGYTSVMVEVAVPGDTLYLEGFEHTYRAVMSSGVSLFGEDGWFVTKGKTQAVEFDTTTNTANNPDKKSFTYGATLNKYGLWIEAVVKADSELKTSGETGVFSIYFRPNTDNGAYQVYNYSNAYSWSLSYARSSTALNAGYANTIYAKFFIDYEKLSGENYPSSANSSVKYLWGTSATNPITIESTVYLNMDFKSTASSDTLDYYYRSNVNLATMSNYQLAWYHTTNNGQYATTDSRYGAQNLWCVSRKFIGMPIAATGTSGTFDPVTKDGLDYAART